ncbi:Leucine-rich repeat-containing protein [Artemisia annua]|uniref:Leucine-rich repeat-containing protein n=1 Tax=Artemisia annua TaxID=35608 RepID=A0A2U1PVX8_ARTAN|nr:Leucine-rich repeat-containing protein [Artemisia annua]
MRTLTLLLILTLTYTTILPQTSQHPNDESCLTHLFQSFKPNTNLKSTTFSNPCSDFTSNIPGATCNNGRIYKLSLQNLNLVGPISPFISNCTNLQSLDLSNNTITGTIPVDFKYLVNLAVLNLSSNHINGNIPPELANCNYLNVIDLHGNVLSGNIPFQLGSLVRLNVFDVSYNKLSGVIPESVGRKFNVSSFVGNKGLYGYPLSSTRKSAGSLSVVAIVCVGLGSGLLSLVFSFSVVCVWLRLSDAKRENEQQGKARELMPDY